LSSGFLLFFFFRKDPASCVFFFFFSVLFPLAFFYLLSFSPLIGNAFDSRKPGFSSSSPSPFGLLFPDKCLKQVVDLPDLPPNPLIFQLLVNSDACARTTASPSPATYISASLTPDHILSFDVESGPSFCIHRHRSFFFRLLGLRAFIPYSIPFLRLPRCSSPLQRVRFITSLISLPSLHSPASTPPDA